mgnify:CR=1 FL=1
MNWKYKALIQNAISILPSSLSYNAYYYVQRNFGGLKNYTPLRRLLAGVKTWNHIIDVGQNPVGKTFFEVGTGHIPVVPIAYYLMGSFKTFTIDINPYLKDELLWECIRFLQNNKEIVRETFGSNLNWERYHYILDLSQNQKLSTHELLDEFNIKYIAPADASKTSISNQSIDYHTSYTVFEHIPPAVLKSILTEGNRLLKDDGLFIHRIDYSDHFSHGDKSISSINFLKYNDDEWNRYADNKYMYMNRLRHDDYIRLFESVGHQILKTTIDVNNYSENLLRSGNFKLSDRFKEKAIDILKISGAWIISRQKFD